MKSDFERSLFSNESPIAIAWAQKEGIFEMNKMIKQAKSTNEKKDLEISDNFFDNIAKLTASLKFNGLDKYAQAIEDKFFQFEQSKLALEKLGQCEFSELLDQAHPDGSPEVAEAKDHEGEFETLLDQHKKMMDFAHKKNSSILNSVGKTLGVKFAQDITSSEDALEGPAKKIARINGFIQANWAKIKQKAQEAISKTGKENYFTLEKLTVKSPLDWAVYANSYATFSTVPFETIKSFTTIFNQLYKNGSFENGADTIANVIQQYPDSIEGYRGLLNFMSTVDKPLAQQYFYGFYNAKVDDLPALEAKEKSYKNEGSIWKLSTFTDSAEKTSRLTKAAAAIHELMKKRYDDIFGKIEIANAAFKNQIAQFLSPLTSLIATPDSEVLLNEMDITTAKTMIICNKLIAMVNQLLETGEFGQELNKLLSQVSVFPAAEFFANVKEIVDGLTALRTQMQQTSLNPLDVFYSIDVAKPTAQNFKSAAELWNNSKSKDATNWAQISVTLLNAVRAGAGNKYLTTWQLLPNDFKDLKTQEALYQHSGQWLAQSQKMATAGYVETAIIKSAAPLPGVTPSASPGVSAGKPGSTNTSGGKVSKLSPQEIHAVQMMQSYLRRLGEVLGDGSHDDKFEGIKNLRDLAAYLINTGKKIGGFPTDGIWEVNTAKALKNFKFIAEHLKDKTGFNVDEVKSINAIPYSGKSDTITKAQEATVIVSNFTAALTGMQSEFKSNKTVVYDIYNGISLTSRDLLDLAKFYIWALKNKLLAKDTEVNLQGSSTTGVIAQKILELINMLSTRARELYERKTQNGAEYYQAMINISNQIMSLIRGYKLELKDIIPEVLISQTSTSSSGVSGRQNQRSSLLPGGWPQGAVPLNEAARRRMQQGRGQGGEGQDYGSGLAQQKLVYPLNETIDLTQPWYSDFYSVYQQWIPNPYLQLNVFTRYSIEDLASSYFASANDPMLAMYGFVNSLGKAMGAAEQQWIRQDQPTQEEAQISTQFHLKWANAIKRLQQQYVTNRGRR